MPQVWSLWRYWAEWPPAHEAARPPRKATATKRTVTAREPSELLKLDIMAFGGTVQKVKSLRDIYPGGQLPKTAEELMREK